MHLLTDKKNRLIAYILLFLLLSTFNNLSLINSQFLNLNIKNINVSGLTDEENYKVSLQINKLILPNIFFIKKKYLTSILKKNNLIHSFKIKKIYPGSLNIEIKKTKFLAISNYDNQKYLLGSNGKLIKYKYEEEFLPNVFGKIDAKKFIEFRNIIDKSKFNYDDILEIYFFPSGRSDIKLRNSLTLKLPKKNLLEILNLSHKIIINKELKKNKIIDFRVQNKVIFTND